LTFKNLECLIKSIKNDFRIKLALCKLAFEIH
jgi:hypothetical protein